MTIILSNIPVADRMVKRLKEIREKPTEEILGIIILSIAAQKRDLQYIRITIIDANTKHN